ncbi:MAG: metallopeptidase family protein [Acidobacteria bacterium]|nr:metallopeptidase family protein [Acidobacteriota bacterium]
MARLSRRDFEALVEEALQELPPEFQRRLHNVVIAVEEEPSEEDYDLTDTPDDADLLGVYRGPLGTQRHFDELPVLPPQIAIFRGPILRATSTRREAIDEIKDTVVHELGHYFGLEDEDMDY